MAETKLRATHFVKGDRWVYLRSNVKGITSHSLLRHEEKEFPFDRVSTWLTDDKRIVQVVSVVSGSLSLGLLWRWLLGCIVSPLRLRHASCWKANLVCYE